jgi:glutamate racemase
MAFIGVFDSGVGGLSVLREIHAQLPDYPTLYYADQAHLPYGERDDDTLRAYSAAITDFLIAQGAAIIVLACHSASAAALLYLRERYPDVPFVGIEPAVKPAAERTRSGVIGVVTTRATARGALYRRVLERYGTNVEVITQIAPDWVTLVEDGGAATESGQESLRTVIDPLLARGADQIALACTHFPFLTPHLTPLIADRAALIDPGPAVAAQTARLIARRGIAPHRAEHRFFTSGPVEPFARLTRQLLDAPALPDSAFVRHVVIA